MRISVFFYAPVLCLLWLPEPADSVLLSAPEEVRAASGGSVSVSCHYNHGYRNYTKYWCKGKTYEFCTIVVKTPRNRWSNRTFISDNKQRGFFTVTMTVLEEHDEDMYWCVIARNGRNIYTGVRLRVSPAVATSSTTTLSASSLVTQDEVCDWWVVLRWILFILMLACLISTHVFSLKMTTSTMVSMKEFPCQISNVTDES